jgi:hypothetical protein
MIAVALGLISLVVMIATGVVASSGGADHLIFLGIGVHTTTAQVFVTGAIFGWLFLVAIWLLRIGIHRSGERCAELAARRGRRSPASPSAWLGFGPVDPDEGPGWSGWDGWDDWDQWGRRTGVDRTGAAGHGGRAPWRADRRADEADRAVAGASEQGGAVRGGDAGRPVAGRLPGIGVAGGREGGQIGPGGGPVPGEDRGTQGEHRGGDRGEQPGQERGVDRR